MVTTDFDEKEALAKWNTDHNLREEFAGDVESFLAYEKAMAAGQVKILKGAGYAR